MDSTKHISNLPAILKAIDVAGGIKKLSRTNRYIVSISIGLEKSRRTPSPINCQKIEKMTEGQVKAEDILPNYPWQSLK